MENSQSRNSDIEDLEWINLRKNVAEQDEPFTAKCVRKFKENPLIPIGGTTTVACLMLGLWNLKQGRSKEQQFFMRARVLAQTFTIAAFVFGIGLTITNTSSKND